MMHPFAHELIEDYIIRACQLESHLNYDIARIVQNVNRVIIEAITQRELSIYLPKLLSYLRRLKGTANIVLNC